MAIAGWSVSEICMVVVMVFGDAVWWRVGCDPRGVCVGVEVGKRREGGRARLRGTRRMERRGGEGSGEEKGRRGGEEEGRETRDHTLTLRTPFTLWCHGYRRQMARRN